MVRQCGFGFGVINADDDYYSAKLVGHESRSVPGKQIVPRSEAVALLHALVYTRGNAVFVCDNYGVYQNFHEGTKYYPAVTGLFWPAIHAARESRFA